MNQFGLRIIIIVGLSLIWMPFLISKLFYEPSGFVLMNLTLHNWADYGSYAAWVRQAADFSFLFKQLNTTEFSNTNSLLHPLFFLTGVISRVSMINAFVSILILRTAGFLFLVYALTKFSTLLKALRNDVWYFIFLFFSSGLGWFFNSSFVDLTQSESSLFFSIFASVLNPVSLGLILLIFYLYIAKDIKFKGIKLFSAIFLLGLTHTYDLTQVLFILGVYSAYNAYFKKQYSQLVDLLKIISFALVPLLIQSLTLLENQSLGVWAFFQTGVAAPLIVEWLMVYCLFLLFTAYFLFYKNHSLEQEDTFLIIWLIAGTFLLFNPFSIRFQQKLSLGMFIPLATFAYLGIRLWFKSFADKGKIIKVVLTCSIALIFSYSNLTLVNSNFGLMPKVDSWHLSKGQIDAAHYLDSYSPNCNKNILSSYQFSNSIPGLSGCSVYLGHYDQTVNFQSKEQIVKLLLSGNFSQRDPLKFFVKWENINYIFVDEEVRSWGGLDVTNRPYLKLVYENSDVQIYQIQSELLN